MRHVERIWYDGSPIAWLLWPLSLLFAGLTAVRRGAYRLGILRSQRFPVPIIVVGNISVGGTGKTPLVIWLADYLKQHGFMPGVVSRGYGGRARHWPQQVRSDSDPATVGDEALVLAARTGCPMCVGPDRPAAVAALLEHTTVDIVLCDDGMQHYALARDLEIAVIDGERRFGNGMLLPAGPLREPQKRLNDVDLIIANGRGRRGEYSMEISQPVVESLDGGQRKPLSELQGEQVHAVAGVGNPGRFFDLLRDQGLTIDSHAFPDHHVFKPEDLQFGDQQRVLMTEKDAVKCRRLGGSNCWVVRVNAQPDAAFVHQLSRLLKEIVDGQETAGHSRLPDL